MRTLVHHQCTGKHLGIVRIRTALVKGVTMTTKPPEPALAAAEPGTLTVADVALDLRMSTRVVREMMADGSLPAFRVGRVWRIEASEYAAWKVERRKRAQRLARMGA